MPSHRAPETSVPAKDGNHKQVIPAQDDERNVPDVRVDERTTSCSLGSLDRKGMLMH